MKIRYLVTEILSKYGVSFFLEHPVKLISTQVVVEVEVRVDFGKVKRNEFGFQRYYESSKFCVQTNIGFE